MGVDDIVRIHPQRRVAPAPEGFDADSSKAGTMQFQLPFTKRQTIDSETLRSMWRTVVVDDRARTRVRAIGQFHARRVHYRAHGRRPARCPAYVLPRP